ncbi:helix-turn-helix domain-containing protein [Streptomyces sp. NPDC044780]|uniref:helix-turn-helix domain-containing protein n=1 Tax=unclassified Streptomyces TaxID=2593676 RepID=UPI0033E9AF28
MFTAGRSTGQVARELRVTAVSVGRWRRAWETGGPDALVSMMRMVDSTILISLDDDVLDSTP